MVPCWVLWVVGPSGMRAFRGFVSCWMLSSGASLVNTLLLQPLSTIACRRGGEEELEGGWGWLEQKQTRFFSVRVTSASPPGSQLTRPRVLPPNVLAAVALTLWFGPGFLQVALV